MTCMRMLRARSPPRRFWSSYGTYPAAERTREVLSILTQPQPVGYGSSTGPAVPFFDGHDSLVLERAPQSGAEGLTASRAQLLPQQRQLVELLRMGSSTPPPLSTVNENVSASGDDLMMDVVAHGFRAPRLMMGRGGGGATLLEALRRQSYFASTSRQ